MSASSSRNTSKGKERATVTEEEKHMLSHTMEQLVSNGFISKPFDTSSLDNKEAAKLERCLTGMLTRLTTSQQDLARLLDKHRSLASDLDRLEQGQSRSKQTLDASEHEKEQAKAKAIAAAKELAIEQAKHALAKDEVQKARLALSSVKTMASHDSKRRENEVASVLSRWQKVASLSASSSQHATTIIVNSQEKIGKIEHLASSRDNGRETPSGMTLLEESLRRADDERHLMQEENIHLREVMGDIMTEIRATLSSVNVEMPPLQQELNDPFIQVTSPHLTLSPNELLDYLSKLLVTLRDATHSALQASEETVSTAILVANTEASTKISQLEKSLVAMQCEIDAARADTQHVQNLYDGLQDEHDVHVAGMALLMQTSKKEKAEAKEVASKLEDLEKAHEKLRAQYDEEKRAWKKDRESIKSLQKEIDTLKRSKADQHVGAEASSSKKRPATLMDDSPQERTEERPAKREARSTRQSSTSAALKHILASSADTPPTKSVPLTSKPVNSQPVNSSKTAMEKEESNQRRTADTVHDEKKKESEEQAPPSSAALAAKDRIHRAVEAAKARNGTASRSERVTQHRK